MRQMTLIGFLQAQNCTNFAASWRHPDSRSDFLSVDYYQHIGRILEEGKFDLGFFDDRLAMPDILGGDHAHTVSNGIRCVKMDPVTVLTAIGMATSRLGLGSTYSTTYYEPFHIARVFATLDLMTGGRAAWNVVTSLNDSEARNMGRSEVLEHDLRYDAADEFLEVVHGHWDTWEEDAIVLDKTNNLFARPEKVHRLDYEGRFHRSRGPFTVPRSPQGNPVIIQAGQSGRGRRFAARWAELVFVMYPSMAAGRQATALLREEAEKAGRDPSTIKVANLIHPVVAATKTEAEDKCAAIAALPTEGDSLSLLSEALNFDFASKGMDEPFTEEELASISGLQAIRDRVLNESGKANPTVRDFIHYSGRGQLHDPWVGGPKEVADIMEQWFEEGGCDGFVVAATYVPGAYEDFVKYVVPELQRRGLFRKEYSGSTLRDHLRLPKAERGDWRR